MEFSSGGRFKLLEKLAYWELFVCVIVGSSGLENSVDICLVYLGGNKEI